MPFRESVPTEIYLDNNATTFMAPEVLEAMVAVYSRQGGNPSAAHRMGQSAASLIHHARSSVAAMLGVLADEVVFTSGGSESNNTAILSALAAQPERNEIVVSAVEHSSILNLCSYLESSGKALVHRIAVDRMGRIDIDAYSAALNPKTALASVQWANNETGVLQPVADLARLARRAGAVFHSDAIQAAGKFPLHTETSAIDMLSVSAHKLHGPQGVGALFVRKKIPFVPLIRGGRQERGRRAGSENVAGIVGFGRAADLAVEWMSNENAMIDKLRNQLEERITAEIREACVLGQGAPRLSNTCCIAFPDVEGEEMVTLLDRMNVAVSSGSACAAGSMEPSHVVRAMKVSLTHIRGAVRFSFSRNNSEQDVEQACRFVLAAYEQLRSATLVEEPVYG